MDISLIHLPKIVKDEIRVALLPLGFCSLASYLEGKGLKAEIIHGMIENSLGQEDIVELLINLKRKVFGISLHWHFQTYEVINLIKRLKKKIPDSTIILGGFTASYYAIEIMKQFPSVDFIIKGDSEIPLARLLEELHGNHNFQEVPNLVWRSDRVIENKTTYVIDAKTINQLDFSDMKYIRHRQTYIKKILKKINKHTKKIEQIFYFNCGRGCTVNCSYCGGSITSQILISNRKKPIFMSHSAAISQIMRSFKQGSTKWETCFDPNPDKKYYIGLFKRIRKEGIKIACFFECWSLPTKAFIDEFLKTFDPNSSLLLISCETGSDKLRKFNKGFFYTNKKLLKIIDYIMRKGINVRLDFASGLCDENKLDVMKTLILIRFLKLAYPEKLKSKQLDIAAQSIVYEPASPMFLQQNYFRINSKIKSINDFYSWHKEKTTGGYSTKKFSQTNIAALNELYNAEAHCFRKESFFFKYLLTNSNDLEGNNLKKIKFFCRACSQFNFCFTQ